MLIFFYLGLTLPSHCPGLALQELVWTNLGMNFARPAPLPLFAPGSISGTCFLRHIVTFNVIPMLLFIMIPENKAQSTAGGERLKGEKAPGVY